MREIDPWKSFADPNITEVRHVLLKDGVSATVGIANIRNRTYAVPLVWNEVENQYESLSVNQILNSEFSVSLKLWSQIGNYLRSKSKREEVVYLLLKEVANLDHSPQHQH